MLLHRLCRQNKGLNLKKESLGRGKGALIKPGVHAFPAHMKEPPGPRSEVTEPRFAHTDEREVPGWAREPAADKIPGPTNRSL